MLQVLDLNALIAELRGNIELEIAQSPTCYVKGDPELIRRMLLVLLQGVKPTIEIAEEGANVTLVIRETAGLDLPAISAAVRECGGRVELANHLRILFPVTSEQPAQVLIVDDSAAIRRVLRRVLEGVGYGVIDAADAETAIDILRRTPVGVILTDLQMPGRSGVELARLAVRDFPDIAVIAMSGVGDGHLEQLRRELEIDAALTKPMSPDVLCNAVRIALERKKSSKIS